MRLVRLFIRLEEGEVVARLEVGRLGRDSFALFTAMSYHVSTCHHAVCVPWTFTDHWPYLHGDAKQAMGEGKSGPVEIRLTRLVVTVLVTDTLCLPTFTYRPGLLMS